MTKAFFPPNITFAGSRYNSPWHCERGKIFSGRSRVSALHGGSRWYRPVGSQIAMTCTGPRDGASMRAGREGRWRASRLTGTRRPWIHSSRAAGRLPLVCRCSTIPAICRDRAAGPWTVEARLGASLRRRRRCRGGGSGMSGPRACRKRPLQGGHRGGTAFLRVRPWQTPAAGFARGRGGARR